MVVGYMLQVRRRVMSTLTEQLAIAAPLQRRSPGVSARVLPRSCLEGCGSLEGGGVGRGGAAYNCALSPPPLRSRERLTSRLEEQVRQLASFGAARTKTDRPIDAPLLSARHFRAALGSLASVELMLALGGPHL